MNDGKEEDLGPGLVVGSSRDERAKVVWHPRAVAKRRLGSGDEADPETRGVAVAFAIGLMVILLIEHHIQMLEHHVLGS